jgi:hypothetical protein
MPWRRGDVLRRGPNRNFKERTALVSHLAIFVLLAVFAVSRAV